MKTKWKNHKEKNKMLNLLVVMGRLTKDPELRKSPIGTPITTFSVAVNTGKDETSFFDVVTFGDVADGVAKHLHKGSKVAVRGSLRQRTFTRKDGTNGSAIEIIGDSVEYLDPKPQDPQEPDVSDIAMEADEAVAVAEVVEEAEKKPAFDPYTGKPLNSKAKK